MRFGRADAEGMVLTGLLCQPRFGRRKRNEEVVALGTVGSERAPLVADGGAVALVEFPAQEQAQAARPALGREEGLEEVALHRRLERRTIAPHLQVRALPV